MSDADIPDYVSIGVFHLPDAKRLLESLVASSIDPQIDVDDGIRKSGMRGSSGLNAMVKVFVPPDTVERACSIRDEELKLTGEL